MSRVCSTGCGTELGAKNKSGLCRPCRCKATMCNPEVQARSTAGLKRYLTDPVHRAERTAMSAKNLARWRASPEGRAKTREFAMANLAKAYEFDATERRRRQRQAAYPGIPESRWDECVALKKHMTAAEAKQMIRDDEALRERKRKAAMSPFERDMERLRNGAGLVAAPDFRTSNPDFTIGGIASASL